MTRLRPATLAAILIVIGVVRMATTFRIFLATNDEATHIGADWSCSSTLIFGAALGFPTVYNADPYTKSHGWVAVSDHARQLMHAQGGGRWLPDEPIQRVGKSISLYYVP